MSGIPVFKYRFILYTLTGIFIIYSAYVYLSSSVSSNQNMSEQALKGESLWRHNNCQACHQLYGLGGYLGPDLTNAVSDPAKGPEYTKAMLNLGINSMPVFSFTEEEKDQIIAYLTYVDSSGYFPNREAQLKNTGWVELKYKNNDK